MKIGEGRETDMKMNMVQKILLIVGGAFAGIGAVLTMIFGSIGMVFRPMSAFLALPLFFLILGICFIAAVLFGQHKKSLIVKTESDMPPRSTVTWRIRRIW